MENKVIPFLPEESFSVYNSLDAALRRAGVQSFIFARRFMDGQKIKVLFCQSIDSIDFDTLMAPVAGDFALAFPGHSLGWYFMGGVFYVVCHGTDNVSFSSTVPNYARTDARRRAIAKNYDI